MYLEDFEKYKKLKIEDVLSISPNDLPKEFLSESFKTVNEFIKKTRNLDYECVIYFDYFTGEILKCAFGDESDVSINFDDDEFKDNHVASIHNHPEDVFSPPSGKNFGILTRCFEDYELIAEEFKKADERNADPNILTGKDAVYALYQLMGMEISYDDIFKG